MSDNMTSTIKIEKAANSKINKVDFNNLAFGHVFTDHMFECDFINGEWVNPQVVPYQPLTLDPSAKVFHYGQAVFEGMKAYRDDEDKIWLFRPEDNLNRINISSKRLAIPEFPKDIFFEGLTQLLKLDEAWIKKGYGNSLYIRPVVFATESGVSASPSNRYKFLIICSPAQSYYGGEVRVKIENHYSRSADGGFGYAKAAGNYAGQFYPTKLAQDEGYQQVIWTDASTHKYLEEAGTMNVFFRINDTLYTAPTGERILDGITRKSIIAMAEELSIPVDVRPVRVEEVIEAANNGTLKEIFGAGTAAVINPIVGFGYKDQKWELPKLENPYSSTIKKAITDIQYNKAKDPYGWRYEVK
ncbi:branched-chain amino acid aminotransferase [Zhouia sp. PK063]|uniref:branched-chain amino acid aminotransferase n=1 Tax=Zhouia sp. PK063 TaxID=3373602 RepID=UPI0037995595